MATVDTFTSLFLRFLFSVVFLFLSCFTLMLYVDRVLAFLLVILLRLFVLPRNVRVNFTALHVAPLQARIFFRGLSLQTENLSLRIVDGHVTLAFWGFWFRHPRWSRLHEYMVVDALVGTRCRVRRNLHSVKGTIVAVDADRKKVSVHFDDSTGSGSSLDDDDDDDHRHHHQDHEDARPRSSQTVHTQSHAFDDGSTTAPHEAELSSSNVAGGTATRSGPPALPVPLQSPRRTRLRKFGSSPLVLSLQETNDDLNGATGMEGLGDEVVRTVDINDVLVRSRAGLLQLHLNGMRFCLYNATGKYRDLAKAAAAQTSTGANNDGDAEAEAGAHQEQKGSDVARDKNTDTASRREEQGGKRGGLAGLLKAIGNYAIAYEEADLGAHGQEDAQESPELRAARTLQEHGILTNSFAQRFFSFIGCVEIEICAAQVDIGGAASSHPYFLHTTLQQGEGRIFFTKDGCPALDLYRTVLELTLREVDIRMAKTDSKLSKTQVMRNATLLERARLLVSGVAVPIDHLPFETSAPSELVDQYGIFMDGKDKGTVHLVCYKDAPNVYAGEAVCRGALPTTGVEVLIDTPVVRYGPWLEYCRTQLWQYFLPPNYLPVQELQFEIGKPRPNAGFELLIMFLRETRFEIPFKRRSIVPSPPFGICDSDRNGLIVATFGEGAQYIQPAFFLLPGEEKQQYQGLFIAKNVKIWANCVLERETTFCDAESLQFFLDRQDDRLWNGRKLWNILLKLSGVQLYWYMVYVDYFLDLLNDWQFSACMYHDVPLTTELFNTMHRSVRDCIPNVKRFELFVESMATIYFNVNTHNVVYADDPNDLAHNIMAILKLQSGHFSMILPSDQYQLSFENEVSRPLEASAHDLRAYLSLPEKHPFYDQMSSEIPCANAEALHLEGLFTMFVPNQSKPLPRDNLEPKTGRTRYRNYFNLDIELTNTRGTLTGTHMKGILSFFQNLFLDNTFTIAPDELFWLLAKLQSHATTGKNRRKEFKQFLERSQPAVNDMEVCVTVRLVDASVTAVTSQLRTASRVNLSTGLVTFSYVKQFAVVDTSVSLSPLTVRFPDSRGVIPRSVETFVVVGAVTVGLTKHFGRMPLKPKVHEAMEVNVSGVTAEMTTEQLATVVEVIQSIARHFAAEDLVMIAAVDEARSTAELSTENVVRAGPLHNTTHIIRKSFRKWPGVRRRFSLGRRASHDVVENEAPIVNGQERERDADIPGHAVEMHQWRLSQRSSRMQTGEDGFAVSGSDDEDRENGPPNLTFDAEVEVRGAALDEPVVPSLSPSRNFDENNHTTSDTVKDGKGPASPPILQSYESKCACSNTEKREHRHKHRRRLFGGLGTSDSDTSGTDQGDARRCRPFASQVSYDVAVGFAKFMDECNRADDDSRDYGLFFLLVNVETMSGVLRIGEHGYASLELPLGLTMAHSTVNDGNSNKRISLAIKDVGLQLLLNRESDLATSSLPSLRSNASGGRFLEVLSVQTSLCLRQYVAYPFDNGLENHRRRQQLFVEDNDYEGLIGFPFEATADQRHTMQPTAANVPADHEVSGGETSSSLRRGRSGGAGPEPPTLPRPSPFTVESASPNVSSWPDSAPPLAASGAFMSFEAPDFVPEEQPQSVARVVGNSAASVNPLRVAEGAAKPPVSSSSSFSTPNSSATEVHLQKGGSSAHGIAKPQGKNPSLSSTYGLDERDKFEMSNCFNTCLSASSNASFGSFDSSDAESGLDSSAYDRATILRTRLRNRAFAGDPESSGEREVNNRGNGNDDASTAAARRGTSAPSLTTQGGVKASTDGRIAADPSLEGSLAAHLFYRSFDKAEGDDNGTTAKDYWPPLRPNVAHKVRDRTRFHAPPPIVGFYPNTNNESRAPLFFSHRQPMQQRERDLLCWARCVADNRERSQHKSTSRHWHIAFLSPLTVLVTPEAALLIGAVLPLLTRAFRPQHTRPSEPSRESPTFLRPGTTGLAVPMPSTRLLLKPKTQKSKTRTQQKRWLWEDIIVSVAVPTVEVKLLTRLPVPVENLPAIALNTAVVHGVYTSTIVVRHLRLLISKNRPPTGEELAADSPQKISVSAKLATLAVVTQIEWEPLAREGNLVAEIPDVWYDTEKATLAAMFFTQLAGKGKRDLWRGADGGASNITVSDISVRATRDFTDYVHQLASLIHSVTESVREYMHADHAFLEIVSPSATGSPIDVNVTGWSEGDLLGVRLRDSLSAATLTPPARHTPRSHKGRIVQGKGYVGHLTLILIDTVRRGQSIVVSRTDLSRLEIRRPFCNFVVATPNLQRDYNLHIQGIGEIESIEAHVLPSVMHILHPRTVQNSVGIVASTVSSPKPRTSRYQSIVANSTSTMSATAPLLLARDITGAKGGGINSSINDEDHPLVFIYDGTFTVHQLDLRAKHSDSNYAQLLGKNLTGCADSRAEGVTSRECVQAEALTETISESLRARLRYKANRARERAKRSRYPAPPETTEQLYLRSTASFFAQQMQIHYMADCALEAIHHGEEKPPDATSEHPHLKTNPVFSATFSDVALVALFAQHFNVKGDQTNIHMVVRQSVFESPYCVRAAETLHPQVHALLSGWKESLLAASEAMGRDSTSSPPDYADMPRRAKDYGANDSVSKGTSCGLQHAALQKGVTFQLQATNITGLVGLSQGIVQKFLLPQISCFMKASSHGYADLKLHIHPFSIAARNEGCENYQVVLPHMYILYAQDPIKMLCSVTVGTIAITITPLFVNHCLLTYDKMMGDLTAVMASPADLGDDANQLHSARSSKQLDDNDRSSRQDSQSGMTNLPPSARRQRSNGEPERLVGYTAGFGGDHFSKSQAGDKTPFAGVGATRRSGVHWDKRKNNDESNSDFGRGEELGMGSAASSRPATRGARRQSFLFLLQGVRLSYLTSMTTLRFTIRHLNATADTTEGAMRHTLHWVVHVTDAQAALVDRDDHDQLMATVQSLARSRPPVSPNSSGRTAGKATSSAGSVGYASQTANSVKAAHPLGGFIWGSAALSLTLSSGKVDENRVRATIQESPSLRMYSPELQNALLNSLTNSTQKWELTMYEPLVIVRFGLDALIKQCMRETEEDIKTMKEASREADLTVSLLLHQHKRFQKLQKEKKRIDELIRRAEKERQRKLQTMTECVVNDVAHRRGSFHLRAEEQDLLLNFFEIRSVHNVVATMSNFMLVVPFGDAVYRSVLDELPGTFSCTQGSRHIHTVTCLNRQSFIPSFALKLKMNDISFICNAEVVKHLVPHLVVDTRSRKRSDSMFRNSGRANQALTTSFLFYGRLLALNSHLYFSDGSPLDDTVPLIMLLRDTPILGGRGVLTSYASEEHRTSLNCVSVSSVEAPLRIEKKNSDMRVGVVIDISEPKARISSRILSIVHALTQEQTVTPLHMHVHTSRRKPQKSPAPPRLSPQASVIHGDVSMHDRIGHLAGEGSAKSGEAREPLSLHLDITGRLEASELDIFSYVNPEKGGAQVGVGVGASAGLGGTGGGHLYADPRSAKQRTSPVSRRHVAFGSPSTQNARIRAAKDARSAAGGAPSQADSANMNFQDGTEYINFYSSERFLIMSIPLPGINLQALKRQSGSEAKDDITVVRVEFRAGTIELSPSIAVLAQEVEACATAHQHHRLEGNKRIVAFTHAMESEVSQLRMPLHCPLVEVLVPMPRAYQSELSKARLKNVTGQRSAPSHKPGRGAATGANSSSNFKHTTESTDLQVRQKSRGLIAIHVTLSNFGVILNSEPATSTSFTFYLGQGGSVNLILKLFEHADVKDKFIKRFPDTSLVVTASRLRAECQTKLEVKSLEVSLPAAVLTLSRRSGSIGIVNSAHLYLPFDAEGSEPNVMLRLQHISQLFLVMDLWADTISETHRTVQHLFARGAVGREIAKKVGRTQFGQQVVKSTILLQGDTHMAVDRRTFVNIGLFRAICIFDVGSGSTHSFAIGSTNIAIEHSMRMDGSSVILLLSRILNTAIRSEGILSGGMLIGDIFAQAFVIQNEDGGSTFVRSPELRTFREALLLQQLHVHFKERQLKDVFECKVGSFQGNSMDGIGEEDYTTTDLEVSLRRGTLGVTPSTVPAFLSAVRNVSTIVAEQRRVAAIRLRERMSFAQGSSTSTRGGSLDVKHLHPPDLQRRDGAMNSHSPSNSEESAATKQLHACIPFMGSTLLRVPCGQLRVSLEDTTVLLGAISSGEAAAGCVVVSFPKTRLSFAECACDDYHAIKKVLVIETHNVELFRPGTPRVVIMGFQGVNHFEFFTRQLLGSSEVGFTLALRQTHPWTGKPRFRDFEEMISLVKSFTDEKNADVFQQFGRVDSVAFDLDSTSSVARRDSLRAPGTNGEADDGGNTAMQRADSLKTEQRVCVAAADIRTLKALCSSKFSPQLRFGGDVSVNTEVILNWLGITEKMLPLVVHTALCDRLEELLYSLTDLASERVTRRDLDADETKATATGVPTADKKPPPPPPSSTPSEARKLDY